MTIERYRKFAGLHLRSKTMEPGDVYSTRSYLGSFNGKTESCNIEVLTPDIIRLSKSNSMEYNLFGFKRVKRRKRETILYCKEVNEAQLQFPRFSGLLNSTIIWKHTK